MRLDFTSIQKLVVATSASLSLAVAAVACTERGTAPPRPEDAGIVRDTGTPPDGTVADGGGDFDSGPGGTHDRIAFAKAIASSTHIFTAAAADGTGERPVTTMFENRQPAWSPDGSRIAFLSRSDMSTGYGLFVANADGTGRVPVIAPGMIREMGDPAWSPDGSIIAFHGIAGMDTLDIIGINPDGTGLRSIVSTSAIEKYPTFSPDGTLIAFQRNDQILAVRTSDGGSERVIAGPIEGLVDADPVWSPLAIVFSVMTAEGANLFSVRADGTGMRMVTNSPNDELAPTVAPDGHTVAFFRRVSATDYGIFLVTLDSTVITPMIDHGEDPTFEP